MPHTAATPHADPPQPNVVHDAWERRLRAAGMMDVTWYGLTRSMGQPPRLVLSLQGADGAVHRFRLPLADAVAIAEVIADTVALHFPSTVHSPMSSAPAAPHEEDGP